MCMCSPCSGKVFDIDEESKRFFSKNLPKLIQQRKFIRQKQIDEEMTWQKAVIFQPAADIIFYNCTIYTMEEDEIIGEAMAILKDRVLGVGQQVEIFKLKGKNTKMIDLNQKTILPGFIDPHIHMAFSSLTHWVELSPYIYENMEKIYQKIVEVMNETKEGQWALFQLFDPMITFGYIDISMKGLDEISTTKPILILQANGHVAHVNSAAFKKCGIDKNTPNPPYGRYIHDYDGNLTGQVQETAIAIFLSKIPKINGAQYINNFEKFLSHTASKGCTTLHDCAIGLIDPQTDLYVLHQVFKDPAPVRYSGYIISTLWQKWMQMNIKPQFKDKTLRINGVKCWVDGSTQAGSAYLKQPYIKPEWGVGYANYQQNVLDRAVLQAHKKGFQVGIHANGDAGIDMALKAYQFANKHQKKPNLRHRIQHSTVCHREQLIKMKELAVSPSFLIGHVYYYGGAFRDRILGAERAELIDPMKSALECGLIPTIHSDYNCQPVDPLRCIYNAVTRIMKQNGQVLNYKECVTPYEAVKSITINAAWQCHMEDIVGSLRKGKFADFVILEKDPMKVPETEIIDIKIWQTWKGGEKWYQG